MASPPEAPLVHISDLETEIPSPNYFTVPNSWSTRRNSASTQDRIPHSLPPCPCAPPLYKHNVTWRQVGDPGAVSRYVLRWPHPVDFVKTSGAFSVAEAPPSPIQKNKDILLPREKHQKAGICCLTVARSSRQSHCLGPRSGRHNPTAKYVSHYMHVYRLLSPHKAV